MQQPVSRGPSAGLNLVFGALLGALGLFNVVAGLRGDGAGVVLKGVAMAIFAFLLVRDALSIKKTGQPAIPRRRLNGIGLACLALYFVGVLIKRIPEFM